MSATTRADLRVAALRAAGVAFGAIFFFVAPSLVLHEGGNGILDRNLLPFLALFGLATIPIALAERWLIRRGTGLLVALAAALAVWLYVWVAIVASHFEALYSVEALTGRGFGAALERLGLELRWVFQEGPSDGASLRIQGPRTLASVYVARVPMFFAPTIAAIFFGSVAGARRSWFMVVPIALALLVAGVPLHTLLADRMPPFTYKFPGWNGTVQVLWYAGAAEVFGLIGLASVTALSQAAAQRPGQEDASQRSPPGR